MTLESKLTHDAALSPDVTLNVESSDVTLAADLPRKSTMAFRRFFVELLNFLKKHTPLVKLNVIMQTIAIPSVSSELFEAFAPDSASDNGFCDVISCVAESVVEVTYVDDKAVEVTSVDDSVVGETSFNVVLI